MTRKNKQMICILTASSMQRMSMKIVLPVNKNVKIDQIWEKEYDIDCQIMNLYWRYRDMSMILLLFVTDEFACLA